MLFGFAAGEGEAGGGEDAVERVVIAHRDGIVFVVVTAGTAEGEAEDRFAHGIEDVLVGQVHVLVDVVTESTGDGEEAGGDDVFGEAFGGTLGGEEIAGQLLAEELVVGEVAIEGVDNPVAVTPRVRSGVVTILSGGVGVADEVEPFAPPSFAVGGGGEQTFDEGVEGVGGGVGEEGGDLFRGGGEAGEVVGGTADEGAAVRGGGVIGWVGSVEEGVDGGGGLNREGPWGLRVGQGLEGPVEGFGGGGEGGLGGGEEGEDREGDEREGDRWWGWGPAAGRKVGRMRMGTRMGRGQGHDGGFGRACPCGSVRQRLVTAGAGARGRRGVRV